MRITPFAVALAAVLVAETNAVLARQITVSVNEYATPIPAEMMAGWYRSEVTDEGAVIELDVEAIQPDLEELMGPGATGSGIAAFDIVGGAVEIVSSDGGTVCCAPNAPYVVLRAMNRGLTDVTHALPTRPAVPREGHGPLGGEARPPAWLQPLEQRVTMGLGDKRSLTWEGGTLPPRAGVPPVSRDRPIL